MSKLGVWLTEGDPQTRSSPATIRSTLIMFHRPFGKVEVGNVVVGKEVVGKVEAGKEVVGRA
jgi:hypothetical protein